MQVSVATRAGSAANEDYVVATPQAVVVLDGVSVPAGLETGCQHGTVWFVRQLGVSLLQGLGERTDTSLADVLAASIDQVSRKHSSACDLTHPGTPSATVAVLREQETSVDYLVLADSSILLDSEHDGVQAVIDERVDETARERWEAVRQEATGSTTHTQRRRELVAERRLQRNQPGGYWVASATPEAAYEAATGTVDREGLVRAAVVTDGAARLVQLFGLTDWSGLLDILESAGPKGLLQRVRDAEESDPDGQHRPRTKRHDDATAVYCRFV